VDEFAIPEAGFALSDIELDAIDVAAAQRIARSVAGYCEERAFSAEGDLPDAVSFVNVAVGHESLEPRQIARRWDDYSDGLPVVLGESAAGRFEFDLSVVGPHMLVAGTTGAGKSELLQALALSMAVAMPPDRLSFLLIDYKGGAGFGRTVGLPHTTGIVTDLDGGLAERALRSLGAELRRREMVLSRHNVGDVRDLSNDASDRPPRLVIIVDEFATLIAEVPGFVEGLVDIARRGRSLGVHLILATQRPAGVVDDHLRANMGVRVALRVTDPMESIDIVGTAIASTFSAPGAPLSPSPAEA
jgi:S-DNA-T family DNA segregation ATPase FtsK/SpoIIIE